MEIYKEFAYLYTRGPYPTYSKRMAELLPNIFGKLGVKPERILDLACGEGTFAIEMAKRGFEVVGLDRSPYMLKFARRKAKREGVEVKFIKGDMRKLSFKEEFDLITCWFDSLNYLLELRDLEETFRGVHRALRRGGFFIFDMNTIYGLVSWREQPCNIEQDTPELFEVHCKDYDFERNIATMRIIGFVKRGKGWIRIEEVHRERGYTIKEIEDCLNKTGLRIIARWGDIREMSELKPDSRRVWFVTRKK